MAKKPTEQENQQSREEAFRDGIRNLGCFVNLQIVVNELEICCDAITNNKLAGLPYCTVAIELLFVARERYPEYLSDEYSVRDLLMNVTLAEKNKALEGFKALKQKYGSTFFDRVLPDRENFEGLVKRFDDLYSRLSEHITHSELESKAEVAI